MPFTVVFVYLRTEPIVVLTLLVGRHKYAVAVFDITPDSPKPVVDQLLPQVEKVCEITILEKARYLKRKTLANKKAFHTYIQERLAKAAANE